ncbi:MAG: hypothetical protein HYU68_03365 [Bacteroidetes bacterium]|nr:hypothetical protein [Bacteroidota bacterium]
MNGQIRVDGVDYWEISDSIRNIVDKSNVERGLIYMDSLLVKKVNVFLNENDSAVLKIRHTPFDFALRKIISDSSNNIGLFSFRQNGTHSRTFLLTKKNGVAKIISPRKKYEYYRLLKFFRRYIRKNEKVFNSEEKVLAWGRLSELMNGYNFLYNKWEW